MIRDCTVVAEPARTSPYMHDIVIGDRGDFDLAAEVNVFAAHLGDQLRLARNCQLLIGDKTIINHIVLTGDHYTDPGDPFRTKIGGLRHTATTALRGTYTRLGVAVHDFPTS